MNRFLSNPTVDDQQFTINAIRYLSEGSQLPSNDGFFRNSNGCTFNKCTFTLMDTRNIYCSEHSSHWNKYRWVDFDQRTRRDLPTSDTGIVTMEMKPMTLTSRVEVYRIHWYRGREDIFYDHLKFAKSARARLPDIPQFLGTSIDDGEGDKFIVLAGGGSSLSDVFVGSRADLLMIKMGYFFQLMNIFSTSPFTVLNWNWSNFWELPFFSSNYQLLVGVMFLESHGMVGRPKLAGEPGHRQSDIVHFHSGLQDQILSCDMERILYLQKDLALVKEAIERCQMVGSRMFVEEKFKFELKEELSFFLIFEELMSFDEDQYKKLRNEYTKKDLNKKFKSLSVLEKAFNNSTSRIEELSDDAMLVDSFSQFDFALNNSTSGIEELSDDAMDVDFCFSKEFF